MTLAGVYSFWKYVSKLERRETRRYLEMFYTLKYRNLVCTSVGVTRVVHFYHPIREPQILTYLIDFLQCKGSLIGLNKNRKRKDITFCIVCTSSVVFF